MEWDVTVDEFTVAGELIRADRIRWTGSEEEGLERAGWRLAWSMEDRDGPPQEPVTANVYEQEDTKHVLIDLMALGVRSWVLCRSRLAFWLFVRDWLGALADLKPAQAEGDLREEVDGLREEVEYALADAESCGWFSQRALAPPVGGRGCR
jgi:hypothetical protein